MMKPATFVFLLAIAATPCLAADLRQQTDTYRLSHEAAIVGQLDTLTRLPSVKANPQGLAATAAQLQNLLQARGFKSESWTAAPGTAPVVFGTLPSPGAKRTVVFYAHYDGQPVTPSQWSSDPFAPVMRNAGKDIDWKSAKGAFDPEWRLFGRATADDKASIVAFLTAFDALKAAGGKPSVNLKVIWEGEEESGSAHLAAVLKAHADALKSDLWLIGDGPVHQSRKPTLYFGARGSLSLEATLYGPLTPLHDGHYGNWAPNPAALAADLIAQLRGPDGTILIPGFQADVRPLSPAERAAIAALPPIEDVLKREFGIAAAESTDGLTQSTMRPALNIRGISAGQVGAQAANAIPAEASVSIDFRLVPDQTPAKLRALVEAFLRQKGWTVLSDTPDSATRLAHPRIVKLSWGDGYAALRSDMSGPAAQAVIRAGRTGAGGPITVLPMMGASVPITLFDDLFHVPVIGLPIANHDDNQHAANENLRLRNLWDGIDVYAAMMGALSW